MSKQQICQKVLNLLSHPLVANQLQYATLRMNPATVELCKEAGITFGGVPDPRVTFLPNTIYGVTVPMADGTFQLFGVQCMFQTGGLDGRMVLERDPLITDLDL